MQLTFAVVPLVQFTGEKGKMGAFANSRSLRALCWTVAGVIGALNVWLLWRSSGRGSAVEARLAAGSAPADRHSRCPLRRRRPARPIQDNSFLIEEAYNQDRDVVQHISTLTLGRDGGWAFTFTDEWPVGSPRDQASVGATLLNADGTTTFGVLALNYRRQAVGGPDAALVVAPRLSALVAFGGAGGQGGGGVALQANLPVTTVLSRSFVAHWNLGLTAGAGPTTMNAGASTVWLALPWMNFLVEGLYLGVNGEAAAWVVSPGVRWAINLGKVQVVPGVALPYDVANGRDSAVLLYLSIEHPIGSSEGN